MLIFGWIDHYARALLCVALGLILLLAGIIVWGRLHPPVTETFESRKQAATPAGVEKAVNRFDLVNNRTVYLSPGMAVTAEIKTREKRIIEYFMDPFIKYKSEGLRER